jgi:hypothetical protein
MQMSNSFYRGYETLERLNGIGSGYSKQYRSQAVECTDSAGKIRRYPSVRKASERHHVAVNSIIRACKSGKSTKYDLTWRYLNEIADA